MPRVTGKGTLQNLDGVPDKKCRRWRIYIPYGKDQSTGKYRRYTKVFHGTKTEAQKEMQRLIAEIDSGVNTKAGEVLFRDFANSYYEELYKTGKIRETTYIKHLYSVKSISNILGDEYISDITPKTVSNLYIKLSETFGEVTANHYATLFSTVIKCAYNRRMISFNPCVSVNKPKAGTTKREALTKEQAKKLFRVISSGEMNETKMAFAIMLFCGLRAGEVRGLQWKDIDFTISCLSVNKSIHKNRITPPKTKQSYRTVPMPKKLVEMLLQWREKVFSMLLNAGIIETLEDIQSLYVCCNEAGGYISYDKIIYYNQTLKKELEMNSFTPHVLRHTYATMLCANGVDMITAIHLLGHADSKMIETVYGHVVFDNAVSASEKINGYFDN